jgi:hypothetical protein
MVGRKVHISSRACCLSIYRRVEFVTLSHYLHPRKINTHSSLSFNTSVYRKATDSGRFLNFTSNHPRSVKVGVASCLLNVIPVHKSGNKCDPLNYRPISITSAVCKALEKIISGCILEFLRITNQIDDNQHGFLPRRSCNTMHASIINEWQKHLDTHSGGHIHVLSLDWEKAFDRIPHARLILKLKAAGITGSLLSWIQCYLSERSQRVLVNDVYSKWHNVTSGVIQGSVLGPLLFNIFISDLSRCVSSRLIMYADDSTLFRPIISFRDEQILQDDLNNIVLWSELNGMKLNVGKCLFMDITLSKFRRLGRYQITDTLINHAFTKILGLNIAHNLSWNYHTETVRSKSAKLLGFVNRNLRGCSVKVKRQSHPTLIRPILVFGAPGWHPTSCDNINKIQLIQNRASRFIYGKDRTHELDKCIMSHKNYLSYLDILFFHKSRNGLIDYSISEVVQEGRPIRGQDGINRLVPPRARTTMYQQDLIIRSTTAWNALPPAIKLASASSFKLNVRHNFLACN